MGGDRRRAQCPRSDIRQPRRERTLHGFGVDHKPLFWILGDVQVGRGTHIGFTARKRQQVDAFYAAAFEAGAVDNGPPGIRRYHPNYHGAFVVDPDGINIEAVCNAPKRTRPFALMAGNAIASVELEGVGF